MLNASKLNKSINGEKMSKDKENIKPLIKLDDLAPKEDVKGGSNKSKRVFGAFSDRKNKRLPKDRF